MKLDLNNIKKLAKSIDEHNLSEISIEVNGTKLILKKEEVKEGNLAPIFKQVNESTVESVETYIEPETESENVIEGIEIVSPMVGTYYSTPSPDSEPFVKLGDKIEIGDTICIVEAMKMMNEVKSTVSGTVISVKVLDGKVVKKGEILFMVK
ncbi:MAG: acetyl-CoA carboxylase biotin carboxyl carrier protein [Cetobacterium sp.]